MQRRTHLKQLLAGGALLATAPWMLPGCSRGQPEVNEAPAAPQGILPAIGVQLFLVRDLLRSDPRGTIAALASIGFSELEMFGFGGSSTFIDDPFFGLSLAEFKEVLAANNLVVPAVHFSGTAENVSGSAELALELGARHLIQAMAPDFIRRDAPVPAVSGLADAGHAARIAADLNRLGEACRRSGIGFAYHNHHMEFAVFEGTNAYDVLLAETDPGLVDMELDVGWAQAAGISAADYLEKHPSRFISCHLKDFNPALPMGAPSATAPIPEMVRMVPPGEGIIDFARLGAAMRNASLRHGYLEVDLPQGDPLEVCRRGYTALAAIPGVAT